MSKPIAILHDSSIIKIPQEISMAPLAKAKTSLIVVVKYGIWGSRVQHRFNLGVQMFSQSSQNIDGIDVDRGSHDVQPVDG